MESFFPPLEAIFDERAKHPVLLVDAVEESANVTLPGEIASGKLHGMIFGFHISPHTHSRHTKRGSQIWIYGHLVRRACAPAKRPSLLYLEEELVRWNEERVHLQHPADDHHRVRAQDVHCHACA